VAVEPFHENILRLHKASHLEKTFNKITLIKNAISNKRNEIKQLGSDKENIGGQSLLNNKEKIFQKDENNEYLVETILFNDILPYLPLKNETTKEKYSKAILKIDIEGFEPYAFEHADLLFDTIYIQIIFMEWQWASKFNETIDEHSRVLAMRDFLYRRNYQAFDGDILLQKNDWKYWSWDIIWKKT